MQLHNHSSEQQQVLRQQLEEVGRELLGINFTDPADDEKMIRYQAYKKGQFDVLSRLLTDNYEAPEPTQPNQE